MLGKERRRELEQNYTECRSLTKELGYTDRAYPRLNAPIKKTGDIRNASDERLLDCVNEENQVIRIALREQRHNIQSYEEEVRGYTSEITGLKKKLRDIKEIYPDVDIR